MSEESDGVGDRRSWINTSVDVDTPLVPLWRIYTLGDYSLAAEVSGLLEDQH